MTLTNIYSKLKLSQSEMDVAIWIYCRVEGGPSGRTWERMNMILNSLHLPVMNQITWPIFKTSLDNTAGSH